MHYPAGPQLMYILSDQPDFNLNNPDVDLVEQKIACN